MMGRTCGAVFVAAALAACSLVPEKDRDGWTGTDAPIIGGGDPRRGRALVAAIACGVCHTIPGIAGAHGIVGPPLDGIARKPFIAGEIPNRPATLIHFVQNAPSLVPRTAMPSLPLSDEDARHVVAYLHTLR